MGETLTIRVPVEEKARWEKAAAAARESVAEYVRGAVRQRAQAASQSPWEPHLGSANVAVPAPTNANIRRAFARRRRYIGMIHLLDTGPLVSALAHEEPRFGSWAKDLLRHLPRPLYTCEAVLTEVAHFLGDKVYRRRGRHAIPLLTPNAS